MTSEKKAPNSKSKIRVASWVEHDDIKDSIPWSASDCSEWTYKRDEGDLTVYARSAKEALQAIEGHGFRNLDPNKLKRTGLSLLEMLEKEQRK